MKNPNKGAQSTVEYVIVLTTVILALIATMINFAAKDQNKGVGQLINSAGQMIETGTGKLLEITGGSTVESTTTDTTTDGQWSWDHWGDKEKKDETGKDDSGSQRGIITF